MVKQRVAIIGASFIFLVAMMVAVVVVVNQKAPALAGSASSGEPSAIAKAVQTICQPTDYREACERSLASANTSNPKELMKLAFKAAMKEVALALKNCTELEKVNNDNETGQSLSVCNDGMNSAIENIQRSFDRIGAVDLTKVDDYLINDVQTWLTSAYSYGVMCLDAFEWKTPQSEEAKAHMEKALTSAKELTSNALVLVHQVGKVLASSGNTVSHTSRLLSEDRFPSWVDAGRRRLLEGALGEVKPDVVVAADGSGNYRTLSSAVAHIPNREGSKVYTIYVKSGVYPEYVTIGKNHTYVAIIGEGPYSTTFTGDLSSQKGVSTFKTGTFKVMGANFTDRAIGFENSAGPRGEQAVALHVDGDASIFYNCLMSGYQDTLLTSGGRQFYLDCTIEGTVDFIFGYAPVIFQKCRMEILRPLVGQQCIITADGRDIKHLDSGIIIQQCSIAPSPRMGFFNHSFESYLGRPWKAFSRTVVMNSEIGDIIHPAGWLKWEDDMSNHESTCFYGEYSNYGFGADTSRRVTWSKQLTDGQASQFTVRNFIAGNEWIPRSGLRFTP